MNAVFLDKDGTLIKNVPFNVDPDLVELAPGAGAALRRLSDRGFRLFVVSNQPGIALGRFPEDALRAVEERIQELLRDSGVAIDGFYYCPHSPEATLIGRALRCACRKPKPGLLRRAAADWDIDLGRSWLVGDILDDVEAGRRAGCSTVLLVNGNETEWQITPARTPDRYVRSFAQAARVILQAEPERPPLTYEPRHASRLARSH